MSSVVVKGERARRVVDKHRAERDQIRAVREDQDDVVRGGAAEAHHVEGRFGEGTAAVRALRQADERALIGPGGVVQPHLGPDRVEIL